MQQNRLERLLKMIKEEPEDSFLKYALATEYAKLQDDQTALSYYLDLVRTDEHYVGTYYHLGKLYEKLQQKEEAIAIYQKGMQIARQAGDHHAYSELQGVYNSLAGLDYEDD